MIQEAIAQRHKILSGLMEQGEGDATAVLQATERVSRLMMVNGRAEEAIQVVETTLPTLGAATTPQAIAAQRLLGELYLAAGKLALAEASFAHVLDAVQTSVNPKVIDCPDKISGKSTLSAVAKNGVELKIRARVTVRTNISQLIGGATEETIIARVGEGIITSIGSAESHFDVMEHPDTISKAVLHRGLDAQTAFQIVSIDIADIEVGENIAIDNNEGVIDSGRLRSKSNSPRRVERIGFHCVMQ
jgi:uncharacterized protein YqfA (UPF0365 family)